MFGSHDTPMDSYGNEVLDITESNDIQLVLMTRCQQFLVALAELKKEEWT